MPETQMLSSSSGAAAKWSAELEGDRSFCEATLPHVSRTFALSIALLPDGLREPVCVAYLLCRIVDTIEDDPKLDWPDRERAFDAFDDLMRDDAAGYARFDHLVASLGLGASPEERALCGGAASVFRCFRALPSWQRAAIRPRIAEMSRGMREFTERAHREGGIRVRDVDELERYCAFVAGTVGKLLTDLFERDVPALSEGTRRALRARAVSFGIGLQLVNIVKDVAEDFGRGDCYLPVALTQREGFSPDEVLEPRRREAALRVLRSLCDLARGHLECAVEYTLLWPAEGGRDVRAFCAVPLALALATLREVEDGDDALCVDRKSKVTRECVQRVLLDTERSISDNQALRRMLSHYGATAGTERRAG